MKETDTNKTMRLADKVALITGGAQGIGAAIATRMAEEGARVAIADLQTGGELERDLTSRGYRSEERRVGKECRL